MIERPHGAGRGRARGWRRTIRAVVLAGIACSLALGHAAAAGDAKDWFEALPEERRHALETALLVLANYDGPLDGRHSADTAAAIAALETARGDAPDGILPAPVERAVVAEAFDVLDRLGFTTMDDPASGLAVSVPLGLVGEAAATEEGTRWQGDLSGVAFETFALFGPDAAVPALLGRLADGRWIAEQVRGGDRLMLTGTDGRDAFFAAVILGPGSARGFLLSWPEGGSGRIPNLARLAAARMALLPSVAAEPPPLAGRTAFGRFTVDPDRPSTALFSGPIGTETPLHLRLLLAAHPQVDTLRLDSPGGLVYPALVLALDVSARGLDTVVPEGAACLSACAFPFLAGRARRVAGALGVHQIWNEENDARAALVAMADVLEVMAHLAVDRQVTAAMLRTPPEGMHVFTPAEKRAFAIETGGIGPSARLADRR